ncbi:CDP-alcohol phosphatidyltransferase [Heterostelium album PN500]|uniref:CDP-alcohol phosphatidyltransferase n=1 Tax=Heterostelium pallidum (strain ATCC 26659 / Pp 5 / PN500) TaxID=670386 RepID=D3BS60_HETP5|nr:CDP-alcohol phosphatidyltransferase [Heterostelium album PN500]EFA75797.1 CDP-alcohol phosphatidyltransferase [Heterostelium album PN500]|eukprot:XP_020427931.1 CDP-alcohol phosphatidyltransferase [Heterostelium album PN500]
MDVVFAPYVSERARSNIKQYKYQGCDHSIIANRVLQPFWRWAVEWLPMWMAPNLITLIGFFFIIASYLVTLWYTPSFEGSAPGWTYIFHLVCIFVYQTMDAIDGKQARRTNSSSGLGELFDHGCDAITTFLVLISFLSSIQAGVNGSSLFNVMFILVAFYFTQWEQYHTGVMELGFIGVTEGHLFMMLGHFITYLFGPSIWFTTYTLFGYTIQFNAIPLFSSNLTALITIITNIITVIKSKPKNPIVSVIQIVPILFVLYVSMTWASNSTALVLQNNPHVYMCTFGFIVAFLVGRIVLARICCDSFFPFQVIIFPLLVPLLSYSFGINLFSFINESLFIQLYCIGTIIIYIHFANVVITALCKVLQIQCFKLNKKLH